MRNALWLGLVLVLGGPGVAAAEQDEASELLSHGQQLFEGGNYEQAISELEKAYDLSQSGCLDCLRLIGIAHQRLGRAVPAAAYLEKLSALEPGRDLELLDRLIGLYGDLGQPEKAIAACKSFIEDAESMEDVVVALNGLGVLLVTATGTAGTEALREAEQTFERALELAHGRSNVARVNLAQTLSKQGRSEESLALIDGLIPEDDDAWRDLRRLKLSPEVHARLLVKWAGLSGVRAREDPRPAPPPSWASEARAVGGDVTPPRKIYAAQPDYPQSAREAGVQGVVIVRAEIDEEGRVQGIEVLKGLPEGLTEEAVKAIKEWRFEPATLDGQPVSVYYNLTVNFRSQSGQGGFSGREPWSQPSPDRSTSRRSPRRLGLFESGDE